MKSSRKLARVLLYLLHFSLQCEGIDGEPDDVPPGAVDESGQAAALTNDQTSEGEKGKTTAPQTFTHQQTVKEETLSLSASITRSCR